MRQTLPEEDRCTRKVDGTCPSLPASIIVRFCKVQLAGLAPSTRVTLRRLVQTQCDEVAYAMTKTFAKKVRKEGRSDALMASDFSI